MTLSDEIVPGISLAGVPIDGDAEAIVEQLRARYRVESRDDHHIVEDGLITIGQDADGRICYITCNAMFKGRYRHKLWSGMTVAEVRQNSRQQIAWSGCVVVDRTDGIGLPLPPSCDDFAQLDDFLPADHVFDTLSVFRRTPFKR